MQRAAGDGPEREPDGIAIFSRCFVTLENP
jgi:hypothetical protein